MAGPNMDQFEAYFKRADLDGDGMISGQEAVGFFQGSNLPKHVLAQIWMHADQAKTGFLRRAEFFNALRLVTVAQSKRDLTPDIVKAALYGPAAAKIPAPQINLAATLPPQSNPMAASSAPQVGAAAPPASQNYGFKGQGFTGTNLNQQYFPSQQNRTMRPLMSVPASSAPHQSQGTAAMDLFRGSSMAGPNAPNTNISSDWSGVGSSMGLSGPRGYSPPVPMSTSTPQPSVSAISQPATIDTKALVVSGNGFSSSSNFGTDMLSTVPSTPKHQPSGQNHTSNHALPSSSIDPVSIGSEPSNKQTLFSLQPTSNQLLQTQKSINSSQQIPAAGSSSPVSSGISVGDGGASDNSQLSWPKMKTSDVQKYTKVFMEVDTDRDGKITGEQARNLFLSWRLPREVLKQVWDLSDQDNDSMLSVREFCFALYLMERYREGRPLPHSLPRNVMFDETLLSMTGQPKAAYGNAAWSIGTGSPGYAQQQGIPGPRPMTPAAGLRPPTQSVPPQGDKVTTMQMPPNQQKPGASMLEDSFLKFDKGENKTTDQKPQEATPAGTEAEETQKVILDSKEKLEFYRTKMQELVLYKSRCDNRLNEITERSSADKREAELLGKKYEEKYKQVAEIASKLTIEEARFRDIQERKTELQQAIVKVEQGGSADGILQVRADRIQSDLEELMKALAERCKKHGLNVKSTAIVEFPVGSQPGVPEAAAEWDEDWDKFEDEGFANDLSFDGKNETAKPKAEFYENEETSDDNSTYTSSLKANGKHRISLSTGDYVLESESPRTHSEDDIARSHHGSPVGNAAFGSPSQRSSGAHFEKSSEADTEAHRRSFDDSTWGAFDNDDVDSMWGFNTKDSEKQGDFFMSGDLGLNLVKTKSPQADSIFQTKSLFAFDDSVPETPVSNFGNSPRYSEAGDHLDSFSRFDSFGMHDSSYFPEPGRFTRFDSISSSKDFGYNNERFTRFDSTSSSSKDFGFGQERLTRFDSINSTRDFGFTPSNGQERYSRFDSINSSKDFGFGQERLTRVDSMNSTKDSGYGQERLTRFDSINSTKEFGHGGAFSFDDTDPFGASGPFKVSSETHTPKKSSDSWSAF